MCNDFEQRIRWAEYQEALRILDLGMPTAQTERDLPLVDDVRINDTAAVMRAAGNAYAHAFVDRAGFRCVISGHRAGCSPIRPRISA